MAKEKDGSGKPAAPKVKRPQAKKRELQNEKRRLRNRAYKSSVRTAIRNFETIIEKKDAEASKESLNLVYSLMDRGVKKGVFTVNKAGRTKARLTAQVLALA